MCLGIIEHEFDPEFEVCMKTKLPEAKIGKFILRPSSALTRDIIPFDKEPNLRNGKDIIHANTSYIAGCFGDSGSAQWINIDWSDIKEDEGPEQKRPKKDLTTSLDCI